MNTKNWKQLFLLFWLTIISSVQALAQNWNPSHAIGSITGKTEFVYNQVPDQLVELYQPGFPNSGFSYLWEMSTMPLSGFSAAPGTNNQSSYTFPPGAGLTQTIYLRRKTTHTATLSSIFSNTIKIRLVSAYWEDINYSREYDIVVTGVTTWQQVEGLGIGSKFQTTTYVDGLERTLQTVSRGTATPPTGSSTWGDIVSFDKYNDPYGRITADYLSYTTTSQPGKYKTNPVAEQQQYYQTKYNETSPFGTVNYDNSPLERVKNFKRAGTSWASNAGGFLSEEMNTVDDNVQWFGVNYVQGNAPVHRGAYTVKELFKNVYSDVNGKKVVEFYDKNGNLILKKVQVDDNPSLAHTGWICTYSIYDDFGLLRYQLQPEAVKYLDANAWSFAGPNGTQVLNELCFQYDYDEKGRVIWKKAPGAQPLWMLYDSRDRVVFMQDGNQAAMTVPQWTVNLYDALDRQLVTVHYNTTESISTLQTAIDNAPVSSTVTINASGAPSTTVVLSLCPIVSNINNTSYTTLLKYTLYDNYSYTGVKTFNTGYTNTSAYNTSDPNVQPIAWGKRTLNFITGTVTRVLGTNSFLVATDYYDESGNHIQTVEDNIKAGLDIVTTQYHFDGRVLSTCTDHTVTAAGYTNFKTLTKNLYDQIGRITSVQKQYGSNAMKTIASYSYDDIGRLKNKTLDPGYASALGNNYLESLNYSYNLHDEITGINKDYALKTPGVYSKWSNFFGMYLGYDNRDNAFAGAQLTGHVTGIMWSTQGDDVQRRYDFAYDHAGRLVNAFFKEQPHLGDGWSSSSMDFTVTGHIGKIAYDLNGNLQSMTHKGVLPGTAAPITVDDLRYTYNNLSNKLQAVKDEMTATASNGKFGDFKDGTNGAGTPDYVYDNNGNLVIDLNKNVQGLSANNNGITYNYLDKPEQIKIAGKGIIKIVYSADGEKLQRVFIPETAGGTSTITTYIHEFVYQETSVSLTAGSTAPFSGTNLALSFINFEEGRIRVITPTAQNNGYDFLNVSGNLTLPNSKAGVYDYFITDYQQNVRMILTEEVRQAGNKATMEDNRAGNEEPVFGKTGPGNEVAATRVDKPGGWSNNGSNKVSRLGNLAGKNLGLNTLQKVMAGDGVTATVNYYYQNATGGGNTNLPNLIIGNLLQVLTGSNATTGLVKDNAGSITSQLGGNYGFVNAVQPPGSGGTTPQAFLTILFFDERFQLISDADGGVHQSQVAATWSAGNSTLTIPNIKAPKNGYVYVFLSNRSDQHVYFDDFNVTITNSNILEENHYYAYGLKIAAISSKRITDTYDGLAKNNYLYNDKELWDDGDINWYDYGFRNYDPQIGRFVQLDPLTDDYPTMTPYQYASCEPIANVDLDGLEAKQVISSVTHTAKYVGAAPGEVIFQFVKKAAQQSFGQKLLNWGKKAVDVATDVLPVVGGLKDIYRGIRDGNGWQVVGGVVSVIADIAAPGSGTMVRAGVKTGMAVGKNIVKNQLKKKADDIIRTAKNKIDDVVKKSPCGCFTAGTLVLTADGYKEIQNIQVGDTVWAFNDTTGQLAQKRVVNVFEYQRDSVYHITLANGTIINATSDHPFFIGGRWLKVHELQAGDVTALYSGEALAIADIKIVAQPATVYNFEVEDFHTYYVSEQNVLVHNSGACDLTKRGAASKYKGQSGVYVHEFKGGYTYTGQAKDLGKRPKTSLNNLQKGLAAGHEYVGTKFKVLKNPTKEGLNNLEGKTLKANGTHRSNKTFNQRNAPNQ